MTYFTSNDSPYSVLKTQDKMVRDLSPNQMIQIPKGTKIAAEVLTSSGVNWLIELKGALTLKKNGRVTASLYNGDRYYIAPGQWQNGGFIATITGKKEIVKGEIILPNIPYWQQVDNRYEPMRTCNTSCCAMFAKALGSNIESDDEYYKYVTREGDTTDHDAQTRALKDVGIDSFWYTDLSFVDLDFSLQKMKMPIVIGILHRGSLDYPTGGHMVLVVGKKGSDYIVHDPFGSLNDGYTGAVTNGYEAIYTRSELKARWTADGDYTGYGRLGYDRNSYKM